MPGLIEGSTPLKIEYVVSLPLNTLSAAGLLCAAPEYEGLGTWLAEARAGMSADLLQELCLMLTFPGRYQRFVEELAMALPAGSAGWSFEQLLAHWQATPAAAFQRMALAALGKGARDPRSPEELLPLIEQPAEWAALVSGTGSGVAPEEIASLVCDGLVFKARWLAAIERFWRQVYAGEFEATRPIMERSVLHHRASRYGPDFPDVFVAVTGRLVPEPIAALLPSVRTVTFIPSCYVGPYVAYMAAGPALDLFYNCRSAAGTAVYLPTVRDAALYPPLKALADETRLEILALLRGREMYAQEIVERLNISQPAVSRHLNLMVAAGVLKMRREGNARYYAVDGQVLAGLANALATFV